ncbi:MAG: MBOAT family protein [Clostridia bacterium]|nr:MBOAT family protein [Clostridia bacterium]
MVFSSVSFLFVFLPVTLLLYFLPVTKKHTKADMMRKNIVLLCASLVFYAWGEPIYVFLMLLSVLFNYVIGLDIERTENEKVRKVILIVAVVFNLFVIGFFKYYGFLVETINSITGLDISYKTLALPVGISFYTFQILSYVIDVYRRKVPAQSNIISFALYITLFPQLIAGPIEQYSNIAEQLSNRTETFEKFADGIIVFMRGFARKMLLANLAGAAFQSALTPGVENMAAVTSWFAVVFYAMQVFFDFSGYSDMALGLGKMFGFKLTQNFRYPFYADSISDFWRRWHITLGAWFRDYVFIPLGGSRKGPVRTLINSSIIWFLTGLWHGAAWNFVIWGLYFGLVAILERQFLRERLKKWPAWLRRVYTILAHSPSWMIFYWPTFGEQLTYFKTMLFMGDGIWNGETTYYLTTNFFLLVILVFCSVPAAKSIADNVIRPKCSETTYLVLRFVLWVAIFFVSVAFLISDSYNPFMYFRF